MLSLKCRYQRLFRGRKHTPHLLSTLHRRQLVAGGAPARTLALEATPPVEPRPSMTDQLSTLRDQRATMSDSEFKQRQAEIISSQGY